MRIVIALFIGLLVVTGCGQAPSIPEPVLTTTAPTTTSLPPSPTLRIELCTSAPPVDYAALCNAVEAIEDHHLDPPARSVMAAAAMIGVTAYPPATSSASINCVIPSSEFEDLCGEIAARSNTRDIPALIDAAVSGIFRFSLDPFSSYLSADLAERLRGRDPGQIPGLGLIMGAATDSGEWCGVISETCRFFIVAVSGISPAADAGLVAGDVVVEIDGQQLLGQSPDSASALMAGEPGDRIALTIGRGELRLTRTLIHAELPNYLVETAMLTPSLAYIRLADFSQDAAKLFGEVLTDPDVSGATTIILDLRDNAGGLVLAAQAVASQFLGEGLLMNEITRDDVVEWPILAGGYATEADVIVLTNRGTASAAEIVAAVLQERSRGIVVGEATFGKGFVQELYEIRSGAEMRITSARWTTPRGYDVTGVGILPDIEVVDRRTPESDAILQRAVDWAVNR